MNTPEHREDLDLVAQRFERARIRLNFEIVDVVREAGYDNINKGCRRLRNIENGEPEPEPVYDRFGWVLDIDLDELERQLEQQRRNRKLMFRQQLPAREQGELIESARQSAGLSTDELKASSIGEKPFGAPAASRRRSRGAPPFGAPAASRRRSRGAPPFGAPAASRRRSRGAPPRPKLAALHGDTDHHQSHCLTGAKLIFEDSLYTVREFPLLD